MTIPKLELLEQEMDRKQFLKNVGVGLMLLLGGHMVVGAVTGLNKLGNQKTTTATAARSTYGYGMSGYGR